jgi:molecular chaperone GrpE
MTEEKKDTANLEQNSEPTNEGGSETSHEQQVTQLTIQLNESKDAFLRAKAEVENVRRRASEDVAKAHKFAIESFAEHLLPVMDSMHAALQHHNEDLQKCLIEIAELAPKFLKSVLDQVFELCINVRE